MDFNYYLPVNIVFGRGKVSSVGIIASDHGKKALVVRKKQHKALCCLTEFAVIQKNRIIEYTVFDKVPQNPSTTTAEQAALNSKRQRLRYGHRRRQWKRYVVQRQHLSQ